MKTIMMLVATVGLAVSAVQAKTVNVFFAGGQSNAKTSWASAIAGGLQAGYGSSLVMVWTNHSGEGLANWFTAEPKINYSNDFWNASGTGVLQSQIRAITNTGDKVVFQGIFWFQGETDTGSYASMDAYTNRVGGMLAKLKLDMGLTNDIRFIYAVIDGNSDPYYDDPANTGGRTRADVDYLRAYQIAQGSGPKFAYADTRGYQRSDMWHLLTSGPDELSRQGLAMSAAYTNKFGVSLPPVESVTLVSHAADGAIYSTSTFIDQTLICGVAGTVAYNGIAFFQLPANRIESANLSFTVNENNGPLTNANIDVWGLGFVTTPAMSSAWLLMADTDPRSLVNYNVPFTKLADNLVAVGQSVAPGSVAQLNDSQSTNLTAFLNSLYAKGAVPGDYVVIRVNPDAAFTAAQNFRFGSSAQVSPDRRPKLTVTLADAPVPATTEGVFQNFSHASDGGVYATGTSTANDLISGTGGTGPQDYCGIAFFALPEQPMQSVSLALPVVMFSGALSGANIDVWGLGYQSAPALTTDWFCTNNVDTRLFNGYPPIKLADNIVTSGQPFVSGNIWRPTTAQASNFREYLNGLYNKGAKPGDYAIIRVNMDASQYGFTRGVRWGGSHQANPNNRAMLSGVIPLTTNYLLNAGFEAGSDVVASNWLVTYNGYLGQRTNAVPRSGSSAIRLAVNGDQSTNPNNNINISQDVYAAALAKQRVTFSFYARHAGTEPLVTNSNQKVEARLWWMNGGTSLGYVDGLDPLVPTDTTNVYKRVAVSGVAPTNATGVKAMIIFRSGTGTAVGNNPAITNGAAIVDDLRLTVFEPVKALGTLIRLR